MRPDRTELRQLTSGTSDGMPGWSPDGSKLVFVRQGTGGDSELWTMNADGTNQARLVGGEPGRDLSEPAWSRDGSHIVFTQVGPFGAEGGEGIYVVNPDGSNERPVLIFGDHGVAFPHAPAISPDGARVVVTGEADLFLIDVDGTGFAQLTNTAKEDAAGAWAPDGQWIAFQSDMNGGCIYRIHPDGSGLEVLTTGCSNAISMAYSPDGAYLAWAGGGHGADDITVIDAAGGNARQLTETRDVTAISWGP